jgi:hypothetical protein
MDATSAFHAWSSAAALASMSEAFEKISATLTDARAAPAELVNARSDFALSLSRILTGVTADAARCCGAGGSVVLSIKPATDLAGLGKSCFPTRRSVREISSPFRRTTF